MSSSNTSGLSALRRRALAGLTVCLVAIAAMLGATAMPATAAPGDFSFAEGRFLSGSVGAIDLDDLVALAPATATNYGTPAPVVDSNPLDATVLDAIAVTLPNGLTLFGPNNVIELGAVNQYARAEDNATSLGASGAVADNGAIITDGSGPPANATVNLTELLPDALQANIADLRIETGALSATASQVNAGTPTGDYQIAALEIALQSALLAALTTDATELATDAVDATLAALLGPNGTISAAVNANAQVAALVTALNGLGCDDQPDRNHRPGPGRGHGRRSPHCVAQPADRQQRGCARPELRQHHHRSRAVPRRA